MNEFLSFFGVIALWIAVSYAAWWVHQRGRGGTERRRMTLAREAAAKVGAAQGVFDAIRTGAPHAAGRGNRAQDTHALLKRIQEHGAFFDDVNALRPRLARALAEECEPLAEILHIRRDLWAASEILLVEDFRALSADVAEEGEYEGLREEAARLLFREGQGASGDLIDLRLALAREEAAKFVSALEEDIQLRREQERLPTASEIVAYPVAAIRAVPGQVRSARDQLAAFHGQVRTLAAAIQNSETMAKGLSGLTRAREELPQRVVAGLDRASKTARQGAAGVKSHYDFLVAAYDFQAKYEEVLRKAPVVTERGKQFIARMELAERSERLKLTSATLRDALRRALIRGLAHMIAGLQRLQQALEAKLAQHGAAARERAGAAREAQPRLSAAPAASEAAGMRPLVADVSASLRARSKGKAARQPLQFRAETPEERQEAPAPAPERQAAAPVLKPPPLPKGADPNAFNAVMAWYRPAIDAANAPKPEPAIVEPAIALAAAASVRPEPATPPEARRSWWRRLAGGGRAAKKQGPAGASAPAQASGTPAKPPALEQPAAASPAPAPADAAPRKPARKPGLAAKLTDVTATANEGAESPDERDGAPPEAEDDEAGELTRSILESRDRAEEKPGRSRAFPWLRR